VTTNNITASALPNKSLGGQEIAIRIGVYAFLLSAAIFFVLPLYVMLVTSFKTMPELREGSMLALPGSINLDAWITAWSSACTGLDCRGISPGFFNSIKIVVPSLILSIGFGAVNGYALALWKFPGADRVAAFITLGLFIPYQVVMIPIVQIFSAVGLQGSLVSIVAVHVLFGLPFMTMLFRNFYAGLPNDLLRAALMDGGGFWSIFRHIMLPLSTNVGIVAMIWQFTGIWNDFLLGLIFAGRNNVPMTVQLNNIVNVSFGEVQYNVNMAATLLTAIPPLLIYFFSGKYFVRGVTAGATKG
jgi:glucose/mannose transport system permease protein